MPTTAPVAIVRGLPGYGSIRQIAERFAASRASILTSSNNAAIVHAREVVLLNEDGRYKYEDSAIEIKGIGEVARSFCDFAEVPSLPVASLEVQAAIASVAAASLSPGSAFYESRELPGFHAALASTLQDLRRHRVPAASLASLHARAAELAGLSGQFEGELGTYRMTTLTHRLEGIVSAAPAGPSGLKHVFWIGETEWPPLMVDLIRWMASAGIGVTVLVERHPTDDNFYTASQELIAQLPQATVETLNQDVAPHAQVFGSRGLDPVDVKLVRAPDAVVECERAVASAAESSATIYCRSLQEYAPFLHAAARRVGLTLSLDRQQPLLENPFVRHFLDAVISCATGSIESAASLALSSYSGIPHQHREDVWSAVRKTLRAEDAWGELETGIDGVPSWYSRFAQWRRAALDSDRTLTDWAVQLKQLTSKMPWLDVSLEPGSETKDRDEAAQDAMIRSLEISKITADPRRRISLAAFARHLDAVWRVADCWVRERGEIKVARSPWEIASVDAVIGVGFVEGHFPKRRAEDPLLLDADRRALSLPDSYRKAEEERREFHRLACASSALVLSHPETFDLGEQVESAFLDDIGGERVVITLERRFVRPEDARFDVDRLVAEAWYGTEPDLTIAAESREKVERAVENSRISRIDDETVSARLHELPRPLLAGHVRSLRRCAFQYLSSAKLGLRHRRRQNTWERLADVVRRTDIPSAKTKDQLNAVLLESLEAYVAEMRGTVEAEDLVILTVAGPRALGEFADREIAARDVWGAMPARQNMRLHEAGFRNKIPGPHGEVLLDETIDVLYRLGPDAMPMRFAYVSPSTDDDQLLEDVSILFALNPSPESERLAAIDSLETGTRTVVARKKQSRESDMRSAAHRGLRVSSSPESAKPAVDWVARFLKEQIARATTGDFTPTPGQHCERCGFASLCRSAKFSSLIAQEVPEAPE